MKFKIGDKIAYSNNRVHIDEVLDVNYATGEYILKTINAHSSLTLDCLWIDMWGYLVNEPNDVLKEMINRKEIL